MMTPKAVRGVAQRGRGVPRIMVGYLERVRDKSHMLNNVVVNSKVVNETFEELEIDPTGLSAVEVKILNTLYSSSTPIGQDNLSIIVNESPKTLTNSIEPYLIQRGFIVRSGKGRSITEKGREYLEDYGHVEVEAKESYVIEPGYERK